MTSDRTMRIVHLVEVPEVAPTLVRWFIEEWRPWYGPDGPGDAPAQSIRGEVAIYRRQIAVNGPS